MQIADIKTEKDRLIARIACNTVRRVVSDKEKTELLGRLAEIYFEEGTENGRIAYKIAEEIGMSYRWAVKYLPQRYKDKLQSERARSAARLAAERPNVIARFGGLLRLSKPPSNSFIRISKYANTNHAIYTVDRSLHDKIGIAAKKLNSTPETLVQNAIEEMIKEVSALDDEDAQLLQQAVGQDREIYHRS